MRAFLFHPQSWLAGLLVVLLTGSFFLWFQPGPAMGAAMLALAGALLLAWPLILVLHRQPADRKADALPDLTQLKADLEELGFARGLDQLALLEEKMDNLTAVLNRRLNAGELTFGRYLQGAREVHLSALDNLHDAAINLRSVSTIRESNIRERLAELGNGKILTREQRGERETLEQRKALLDRQMTKVDDLLAKNESALTVIDNTAAALAETRTSRGHGSTDADTAMRELEALAARAAKYAHGGSG